MKRKHLAIGSLLAVGLATGVALTRHPAATTDLSAFLPNPALTPGKVDPSITVEMLRTPGWSTKSVRNVSEAEKKAVYERYRIKTHAKGEYEVDHLCPLECGGSNDIENLWPESFLTKPYSAHQKDALENHLHRLVCDGELTLEEAQKEIMTNWIECYKKYFPVP